MPKYLGNLAQAEEAALSYMDPNFTVGPLALRCVFREEALHIAIQGTNNPSDWIFDLKAAPVERTLNGTLVRLECGFAQAGDELVPAAVAYLSPYKGYTLFMSAHSLGVPLVKRLAARLAELGFTVAGVLCLESPVTGNAAWEAYYASKGLNTLHVRHGRDLVPSVPPLNLGYVMPGQPGETIILDNEGVELEKQDLPAAWNLPAEIADTCRDHSIGPVIRAYRMWYEKQMKQGG